jgi:muconolactone delta-isomerase
VTVLSPEIPARDQPRETSVSTSDVQQLSAENIIPVLIQLRCLQFANDGFESLRNAFESAVVSELKASFSLSAFWRRKGVWLGYQSFADTLLAEADEQERTLLNCRYALSQIPVEQLFERSSTWQSLSQQVRHETERRLSDVDPSANIYEMMVNGYRHQRAMLLREMSLRVLPTVVLFVSTLIAVVMAIFVWRSLFIGN